MILYHYTSFDILCKIISEISDNKFTFYLSHFEYLNDKEEIKGRFEELEKIIYKIANSNPILALVSPETIRSILTNSVAFIGSFCYEKDKLNQWRSYCSSGGVSVGIDLEGVENSAYLSLEKCLYTEAQKEESIRAIFEISVNQYLAEQDQTKRGKILYDSFIRVLYKLCSFKNEAFIEETEYRLLKIIEENTLKEHLRFRTINNAFKPYCEIKLDSECIKEIHIGPTLEPQKLERDIRIFCDQHGIFPLITYSKIPLRVAY